MNTPRKRHSPTTRHPADLWTASLIESYPNALDQVERFHHARTVLTDDWPTWCGLPMAAVYAILTHGAGTVYEASRIMAALGPTALPDLTAALLWIKAKIVYRFDETLFAELSAQPLDDKIPVEALMQFPFFCVYVEAPVEIHGQEAAGFFAWLEYDCNAKLGELRLLYLMPDSSTISVPLILTGGTVDDCLYAVQQSAMSRAHDLGVDIDLSQPGVYNASEIAAAVNLVLYICSVGADMLPPAERSAHPRPQVDQRGNSRRPDVWEVGTRIGAAIRRYRATEHVEHAPAGTHASPRPHIRRAHWHSFWTGPRDGKRTVQVKWLPPIPVNVDDTDLPTTLHRVK